jgi:hypothetical protein
VPLVRKGGRWYFDSAAGRDEILFRRIGANELDAIQICRGFVEAQIEYALEAHDDSGVNQYAQRIISTPGKKDGLYWVNADGTPGGPISEAIARAIEEGYSAYQGSGSHGYYFKVLKGQGPAAPLEASTSGDDDRGFALVAVPAECRVYGSRPSWSAARIVYEKTWARLVRHRQGDGTLQRMHLAAPTTLVRQRSELPGRTGLVCFWRRSWIILITEPPAAATINQTE